MSKHSSHTAFQVRSLHVLPASPAEQPIDARVASDADIAKRAYEKYEARGRIDGFDAQDWSAAKCELVSETFGHLSLITSQPVL